MSVGFDCCVSKSAPVTNCVSVPSIFKTTSILPKSCICWLCDITNSFTHALVCVSQLTLYLILATYIIRNLKYHRTLKLLQNLKMQRNRNKRMRNLGIFEWCNSDSRKKNIIHAIADSNLLHQFEEYGKLVTKFSKIKKICL